MNNRESLINSISDASKAANGFRMRLDWNSMSDSELESTADYYCKAAEETAIRENAAHIKAQKNWEAHIQKLIEIGAGDRATAIRWDMRSMNVDGDIGFYCYEWEIAYELEDQIRADLAA